MTHHRAPRAFTLVELLVVIGIIAVLIGILLPTLNGVREQGRSVSCQSNLRTLGQAMFGYASENKGSLPWGLCYEAFDPITGAPVTGRSQVYTWNFLLNKYLFPRKNALYNLGGLSPAFQCPSVDRNFFEQWTDYGFHSVAMPSVVHETGRSTFLGYVALPVARRPVTPAKQNRLYNDNAVLWDTFANGTFQLVSPNASGGPYNLYGYSFSFIDGGQLTDGTDDSLRYRSLGADANAGDWGLGQDKPIYIAANSGAFQLQNSDDADNTGFWNVQYGAARFRHKKNTECNVLFADGSVRPTTIKEKQKTPIGALDNDFLRKYIMIKPPTK
jgi:prepilin-type N-terminal cleavage/methylation domain-containing protein/prepilin-type processing-associated H-X9-DG protein